LLNRPSALQYYFRILMPAATMASLLLLRRSHLTNLAPALLLPSLLPLPFPLPALPGHCYGPQILLFRCEMLATLWIPRALRILGTLSCHYRREMRAHIHTDTDAQAYARAQIYIHPGLSGWWVQWLCCSERIACANLPKAFQISHLYKLSKWRRP